MIICSKCIPLKATIVLLAMKCSSSLALQKQQKNQRKFLLHYITGESAIESVGTSNCNLRTKDHAILSHIV